MLLQHSMGLQRLNESQRYPTQTLFNPLVWRFHFFLFRCFGSQVIESSGEVFKLSRKLHILELSMIWSDIPVAAYVICEISLKAKMRSWERDSFKNDYKMYFENNEKDVFVFFSVYSLKRNHKDQRKQIILYSWLLVVEPSETTTKLQFREEMHKKETAKGIITRKKGKKQQID